MTTKGQNQQLCPLYQIAMVVFAKVLLADNGRGFGSCYIPRQLPYYIGMDTCNPGGVFRRIILKPGL
jgi:hypothetical protein